jgi:hypothetical protein
MCGIVVLRFVGEFYSERSLVTKLFNFFVGNVLEKPTFLTEESSSTYRRGSHW